jgi:signal transduction histidine kinase
VPVRRREVLLGVALGALGALLGALAGAHPLGIAAGIALGASLPVAPRRPVVAWGTASAAVLVTAPGQLLPFGAEALIGAHCFAAARYSDRRGAVLGLVALGGSSLVQGVVADASLVPFLLLAGTAWLPGRAVREREVVAGALAERARELAEEQEAYAALAVRHERARIAAELHDIVAHAISVMVVQAGAGQRVAAADPALAGEAFSAIAEAARQAEGDMGRLVVLLSDDDPAQVGVDTAEADLALVEDLVAHAARTGLDVALRLEGRCDGVPGAVAHAAHRVVQESLTNALRYAAGAAVSVRVRGDADTLELEVVNGPAPRAAALAGMGTGNGLRGLRERVQACGGRLDAGPLPQGGWRVAVRLPQRPAAAVPEAAAAGA